MLLITAPSKTQQSRIPGPGLPSEKFSLPQMFEQSLELNRKLRSYSVGELCTLMKMSEALGENTRRYIENFGDELTPDNAMQAIFTFQGDAYSSLTPEKYDMEQLLHAQKHFRILSGLYGILRPLDLMFPYRLEMGTKLSMGESANLYQFWGDSITEIINTELSGFAEPVVVNLASAEYSKVVRPKKLQGEILNITFRQKKGDGYKTVPIHSKRARGMMVHYVITEKITTTRSLRAFDLDGYRMRDNLSSEKEWVFTRD